MTILARNIVRFPARRIGLRSLALISASAVALAACATSPGTGPVPLNSIAETMDLHREHFRNCYERAFRAERPDVDVRLSFDIMSFGKVQNAKVVKSSKPNKILERCLIAIVSAATFPYPESGHHYEVVYPFRFKGKKSDQKRR